MANETTRRRDRGKIVGPVMLAAAIVWCSSRAIWEPSVVPNNDKIIHLLVFGLLATLVARVAAVQRVRWIGIYAAVLIVSVFGATDEIHQHFTPRRDADIYDWVADTAGAALAVMVYANWRWYRALLEMPAGELIAKRRVEIARAACLIAGNGSGGSPEANRRAAVTDHAA